MKTMEEDVFSPSMEWVVQSHTGIKRLDPGGGCQDGKVEVGQNVPMGGCR